MVLAAASVVVLALTACGDPAATARPADTAVAADPPVIRLAAGGGGPLAAPAAEAADAMSSRMMADIRFRYDGEAPDLTSAAASWYFSPGTRVSDDQVAALAAAFGLSGPPAALPADQGGGRAVGSTDWSGPSITVADDALGSWWYNPGPQAASAMECVAPEPLPVDPATTDTTAGDIVTDTVTILPAPDGAGTSEPGMPSPCEPQPPANVPTAGEAEASARELFAQLGLDAATYRFDTYADEWGAYVTAFLVVDGVETNVSVSVGYGAEGAVTWAGGALAAPVRGADYPRIGVLPAVERMGQQMTAVYDIGDGIGDGTMGATAPDAPVSDAAMPCPSDDPAVSCMVDPPVGAPVEVEPVVVTLSEPQPTLEQVWDVDGTVWLLPGYAFTGDDGGRYTVLAVEDRFLQYTEPAPMPEPLPEPAPVPDQPPTDAPPADIDPATAAWVGLGVDEASKLAESAGLVLRVAREDGEDLAVTADYVEQRFNVAVVDGVVTEILSRG